MIGIRYNEEFLDVDPTASLSWELNNLVFSNSDSSKLPGSFSFPFNLPATPGNRSKLNYPDRVDNASPFIIEGEVSICYNGDVIFPGTMKVTNANLKEIEVYIVANPLSAVKTTPLNELDLGGDRTFADAAAVLAHALDTTADPLDYDYVFFPVFNPNFLENASDDARSRFQNWFNSTTGAFDVDHLYPAMMPFVRLDYLLDKIFGGTEYAFENRFQTTDELRLLVLYNNKSLWTVDGLDTTINLQNHVSKSGAAAFVRKVMGAFCLGIFYNPWNKVLRLIPIQTLIDTPPRHDWTSRILHSTTVNSSEQQPEVITWKRDDDLAWAHYDKYIKPSAIDGELTNAGLLAAAPGTYYVTDRHSYYLKNSIPRYFFKHTTLGSAPADTGKPAFEAELQPLWDIFLYGEGQTPVPDGNYIATPHCRIKGTVEYEYDPGGGADIEVRTQANDIPDRMTIYRGMYPDFDGDDYPLASGLPWDASSNLIGEISLRMDGQYGMYETWWRGWHNMLRNGKNVSAMLRLSLADILNFNFEDKVRIQNQEYFVKKMRITLTPRGLAPVEVDLVSTI